MPADTLHTGRLWAAAGTGAAAYALTMNGLYQTWYADYPPSSFHFFNDGKEWLQMDKMGHLLMSYNESRWIAAGARWTGLGPRSAAWTGFAGGQLIQTSFEILDGFSAQWGFSWQDVGFNLLGSGLFLGQQLGWGEQRITLKMSALPVDYPAGRIYAYTPAGSTNWTTAERRAAELYGTGTASLFLKNYNTLVVWASVNPASFGKRENTWWPRWLNVAVGYGADNLFAGFGYEWQEDKNCSGPECAAYRLDPQRFPRTRQFFLSPDIDLTRLPVRSRWLRALLGGLNIFKIPAPTLEFSNLGKVRFHSIYF